MKRTVFSIFVILAALALSLMVGAVTGEELPDYNADEISIFVDGTQLDCPMEPFIDNGRTLVPMRAIFECLEAVVEWEGTTRTITATKGETVIIMQIGNTVLTKNGVEETMDVAPVIVGGSTFVPLRAVSQALGTKVDWFANMRTASITSDGKTPVELFVIYNQDGAVKKATKEQVMELMDEGWRASNFEKVTLYNYAEAKTVYDYEAWNMIYNGWEQNPPMVPMYAADGREIEIPADQVAAYEKVGWYTEPVVLMYADDGRTMYVKQSKVAAQESVGWSLEEPMFLVHHKNGDQAYVYASQLEGYKAAGWATEPFFAMYAADGRVEYFEQSRVAAQSTVGWSTEPFIDYVYDESGNEYEIYRHEKAGYLADGFLASKPSYNYGGNSGNGGSGVTVPSYDKGYGVWVPTNGGTKYHSRSGCSNMEDPIQIPKDEAIAYGYTACKRCH